MQASSNPNVNNGRGNQGMYTIHISPLYNNNLANISVEVKDSFKISKVKEILEGLTGIPVIKQQLIHAGKELINDATVEDYHLKLSKAAWLKMKPNAGGSKNITTTKKKVRKIYKGPRGGKYYISKGRKNYI